MAKNEKKLIINISASKDSFGAFAENCTGLYAQGDSVRELKQDVYDAIEIYKEITPEAEWAEPIRDGWPIEWHYDMQSLLLYYPRCIYQRCSRKVDRHQPESTLELCQRHFKTKETGKGENRKRLALSRA